MEAMHSTARPEGVASPSRAPTLGARAPIALLAGLATDLRGLALFAGMAVVYSAVARVSLLFVLEPQHIAGIWPPAGIALGALLLTPRARWLHVTAGVAIAVLVANLMADVPAGMTAGFVLANTVEPLLAAVLLQRAGFVSLATLRGVGLFFGIAVIGAPALAGVVGTASAALGSGAPIVPTWASWVLGDAGGIMAITPLMLSVGHGHLRRPSGWARVVEGAAIAGGVIGLTAISFLPVGLPIQLQAYPVFLLLVIAAVRFGVAGAAAFTSTVAVLVVGGTIAGGGPIVALNPGIALHVGQAQVLVAVAFLASFVTAAAMAERKEAADALTERMADEHERAQRSERVTAFAREISRSLDADALFRRIVQAASEVMPADVVQLTVASDVEGAHTVVAALGAPTVIGRTISAGDGVTGAVIQNAAAVTVDRAEVANRASTMNDVMPDVALAITCTPLVADGIVIGTLGMARMDLEQPFVAEESRALGMMGDLAAIALANALEFGRVHDRSIRDQLTGVPNRRYFDLSFEQLAALRERQPAEGRQEVSVIIFDLDHFGAVNKERGHPTGDRVLAAFGQILATRLRRADIVARYGGEEFVAVLVGTGRDGALVVAEDVRAALDRAALTGADGGPIRTTVSAGIATIGADEPSLDRLLSTADVALAMAKRAGRNQVAAA